MIPFWMRRKGRPPKPDEVWALALASAAVATGRDHKLLHPGTTDLLHHMIALVTYGDFGVRLRDTGVWATLRSDRDAYVLGDHPVTYTGQDNPAWPVWRQEELPVQITMPISHEVTLEIRRSPRIEELPWQEIDQINLRAWHWSDRFLIARGPEPLVRLADLADRVPCRTPPPLTSSPARRR